MKEDQVVGILSVTVIHHSLLLCCIPTTIIMQLATHCHTIIIYERVASSLSFFVITKRTSENIIHRGNVIQFGSFSLLNAFSIVYYQQ